MVTDYAWNSPGRLAEVDSASMTDPVTLTYNAAGKRVGKAVGADKKKFLYDYNRLLQELDADTGSDTFAYRAFGELKSGEASATPFTFVGRESNKGDRLLFSEE